MLIETLTINDLDAVKALQPEDWSDILPGFNFYLANEYCRAIKIVRGNKVIGIGASIRHKDTAWLAGIIVHPDFRKNGIGTLITTELIEGIDSEIYQTIYLIATPLGEPVYKKLGFETETEQLFYHKGKAPLISGREKILSYNSSYREQLLELDLIISGESRETRLEPHLEKALLYVKNDELLGYYLPDLIEGPVYAIDETAGIELLKLRLTEKEITIVPVNNLVVTDFLSEHGYMVYRTAKRMRIGPERNWHPEYMFSRISGQIG